MIAIRDGFANIRALSTAEQPFDSADHAVDDAGLPLGSSAFCSRTTAGKRSLARLFGNAVRHAAHRPSRDESTVTTATPNARCRARRRRPHRSRPSASARAAAQIVRDSPDLAEPDAKACHRFGAEAEIQRLCCEGRSSPPPITWTLAVSAAMLLSTRATPCRIGKRITAHLISVYGSALRAGLSALSNSVISAPRKLDLL